MDFLDAREVGDGFILTFEGRPGEVDAAALGEALLGVSAAIARINALVDPDDPIEIYVEALLEPHGAWENVLYEITTVYGVIPGPHQDSLPLQ